MIDKDQGTEKVALSIPQPWIELILTGIKTIEVRTWSTEYRGELWLHAGKKADKDVLKRFNLSVEQLTFGAIIGKCFLFDCVEFDNYTWRKWYKKHLVKDTLEKRKYAWYTKDPKRIVPQPFRGRLGLMRINE